jgi:hypothetical protein
MVEGWVNKRLRLRLRFRLVLGNLRPQPKHQPERILSLIP